MNIKLYVVLFSITVSTILLLNSVSVAQSTDNDIYNYDGNKFVAVPGNLQQISVGADGSVWGFDSYQRINKYDGSKFYGVAGLAYFADEIAVGNKDNVWGVVAPSR